MSVHTASLAEMLPIRISFQDIIEFHTEAGNLLFKSKTKLFLLQCKALYNKSSVL